MSSVHKRMLTAVRSPFAPLAPCPPAQHSTAQHLSSSCTTSCVSLRGPPASSGVAMWRSSSSSDCRSPRAAMRRSRHSRWTQPLAWSCRLAPAGRAGGRAAGRVRRAVGRVGEWVRMGRWGLVCCMWETRVGGVGMAEVGGGHKAPQRCSCASCAREGGEWHGLPEIACCVRRARRDARRAHAQGLRVAGLPPPPPHTDTHTQPTRTCTPVACRASTVLPSALHPPSSHNPHTRRSLPPRLPAPWGRACWLALSPGSPSCTRWML